MRQSGIEADETQIMYWNFLIKCSAEYIFHVKKCSPSCAPEWFIRWMKVGFQPLFTSSEFDTPS